MGDPIEREFENYEDFYEFFTFCIRSVKAPDRKSIARKEIAFRLRLTQSRLSQRLSPSSENCPRFGLNDFVLYMLTFKDWRPLDYLQWFKKKYEEENAHQNGKELRDMRKQMEGILSKIDGLIQTMEIEK